jgi:hypothetical protein
MSTKKKKPAIKVSVEPVVDQQQEPAEEFPSRQIEVVPTEEEAEPEPVGQSAEPEPVAETAPTVEPVAEVKPQPVVEPVPAPVEVATKPEPPSKPKPLTMISLHNELEALRQTVGQQGALIAQLMETPVRQRKPPTSNGKVQIKDTVTGKIYPSKNNVYQSLLKAGELKDLVDKGIFGANPEKNSFGCYNLFRAWPNRFEEVHDQEESI